MTAFDAVLFDCDGVLVDSESITNRVLCTMLNESGWAISQEECTRDFIGKTVRTMRISAGPSTTITIAGKMQVTKGKSILVGTLAASSSARKRDRASPCGSERD